MTPMAQLVALVRGKRLVVLSGAGCSTVSGIPDYGGLHSQTRSSRIQYRAFVADPLARRRYWARSALGWSRVARAVPNAAHRAIAELEAAGIAHGVITQNVDGLHHRAGNNNVVELHGTLSRVRCMACSHLESRAALQEELLERNPFLKLWTAPAAPDGDAELDDEHVASVSVPDCDRCGGLLKPDVVFFGENVPQERVDAAWQMYDQADVLLAAGTSLAVFSGYRFVLRAVKQGRPVAIVNDAETRGDADAAVVVQGRVEDVLPALAHSLQAAKKDSRVQTAE